ncbi:hypothetical protein COLO4_24017 [Corchorus olitorius]|uniref:Uncharacterized protein n=1 Tax=Corchorus olitorius TaxID=93759 RepID=A0A1R3IDP3_9ROSI|nr:hypothetical protein COLO4_24017 [Corchorus olitorius]
MEGSKVTMILTAYTSIPAVVAIRATIMRKDLRAIAPSPMDNAGAALGTVPRAA